MSMKVYPYFIPLFRYSETMSIKFTESKVKTDKAPFTTPQAYLKEIKESNYSLTCSSLPRMILPAVPSTVMICPVWIRCVAVPVPSTAGMPYSRATIEL